VFPSLQSEPAPRKLAVPVATYDGDLASINSARELPDGRVLLSDYREPAIRVIDLRAGTATTLGRKGSGPNEYQKPGGTYAVGDSTLILDNCQPRALMVDPSGRIVDTRSVAIPGSSSCSDAEYDRQRLDRAGRLYFEAIQFGVRQDSTSLVRWDPARRQLDTIARLRRQEETVIDRGGGASVRKATHFSPADGWGVAPDGRVAIVRAVPYRVEWIAVAARRTRGPAVTIDPIRVTEQDKAEIVERRKAGGSVVMGRTTSGAQGQPVRSDIEDKFADLKPPFEPSGVFVAPDGLVWVRRSGAAAAADVVYDVFVEAGARVDRLQLGPGRRIVGVGRNAIYVSRLDDDDLPHLEKYALTPRASRSTGADSKVKPE
jgi:hypothetical protein